MLKGGIIGFGGVGQKLLHKLEKNDLGAQITAVCNRGAEKLKLAADKGLWTTHSAEELCAREELDFVCVYSNNYAHCEQVELAAKYGKHIFCEKPIALTLEEADRMVKAVRDAGVINVVNFTNRYRKSFIHLKQLQDEGKFGEIKQVLVNTRRGFGLFANGMKHRAVVEPEESGGWIVHHACHAVDAIEWYGGRITSAFCRTATTAPQDSPEFIHATMTLESGALAGVSESLVKLHGTVLELQGVEGSAALEILSWKDTKVRFRPESYVKPTPDEEWLFEDSVGSSHGFKHFLECLREKKRSEVDIAAARENLRITLALAESARTGQVVGL